LAVFNIEFQNGGDGGGTLSVAEQSQERPELYARNTLRGSDVIPTAILGLTYRPLPQLTISASYRPRFHIVAEGDITVEFPEGVAFLDLAMTDPDLSISLTMPDILRGGIQWAFNRNGREFADIELDLVWERWSMTENFLIEFDGQLYSQEAAYSAIVGERDVITVEVPKYFNDTLSIRVGGDVRINDALTVRTGSFYEGGLGNFFNEGATAPGYANLDFLSFRRIGLSLGASYEIGDWSIDLAAMHIFSPHFEEENGQLNIVYPLWICNDPQDQNTQDECDALEVSPLHSVNNGGYDASYDLISLGFTLDL
jgi:long-subunit fatty acid transport protein